MKTEFGNLAIAAITILATFKLPAQGYIVPNGVTYVGLNFFGAYEIDVVQNPTNSDYTGFFLTPQGKTPPTSVYTNTFSFGTYLDEGVRVFVVSSDDPISLTPILMQQYAELGSTPSSVFESSVPFYVGLYTGYSPANGVYSDPLFGWARLVNNQGVIQLLDSALSYQAGGIYVGTQNLIPVPEPSGLALLFLSGSAWGIWRLRRRRP